MQDPTLEKFIPGQRWVSDSEPELGLGLVMDVEHRMLSVDFPLNSETRLYAKNNAPLSRINFMPGDEVHDREQNTYQVVSVDNVDGLLVYQVSSTNSSSDDCVTMAETALSDSISLNQPLSRLISGQVDHSHWFQLRATTLDTLHFIEKSSLLGLCSARTELIAHQLYIANEVAQRHAPRVLLADEVGLGKTIEACLIMQQQLFSGQASRVLIIVPESLVHQWLVELLRRFNLAFSIFDAERCLAIEEDSGDNPFDTEQFVLCSNDLFIDDPALHAQAIEAQWDLLIVDEAHHLKPQFLESLSPAAGKVTSANQNALENNNAKKSAENIAYENIERFSVNVKGLILLTATPDQLGQESHFALLRLLDPDRFHNFAEFVAEQDNFILVASQIEQLERIDFAHEQEQITSIAQELSALFTEPDVIALLSQLTQQNNSIEQLEDIRAELIKAILDRHGTGRILFRNTRKVISGFPQRQLHAHPLPCPELYQHSRDSINPELTCTGKGWLKVDPRITFVEKLLEQYKQEKILLICADKTTALVLEEYLRLHQGIKSSVFHEDMSIIERDRSAAYFADQDSGSQILLCSEIGSEGRNFQFSHHLVLFDLPLNPDLLEQRIGRLDRIGQKHSINIHVPYLQNTAQEVLFRWYQDGLQTFQKINPAAYKVFQAIRDELEKFIANPDNDCQPLLEQTCRLNQSFLAQLNKGRDRLLEINSFNAASSQALIERIEELEDSASPQQYLSRVFDNFGIDSEENSDHSWVINPSDHMVVDTFPAIPDQGITIAYNRELALHREDIQFVNWHHPIIEQSIDLVLQGDLGKSALAVMQDKRFDSGSILLESLYRINIHANKELQAKRFLPSTTLRIVMDSQLRNLSPIFPVSELNDKLQHVDKVHLIELLNENKATISAISKQSEQTVLQELPAIIKQSNEAMLATLSGEIKRLVALKQVNPNIRDSEIEFLSTQVRALHSAFNNASLQLEGVRLIFVA